MDLPVNYNNIPRRQRREVREEYVKIQEGNCYYCKCPLDRDPPEHVLSKEVTDSLFPPNFFKWPIHLHHSHETGMTIGAVHCYCNAVLWEYEGE